MQPLMRTASPDVAVEMHASLTTMRVARGVNVVTKGRSSFLPSSMADARIAQTLCGAVLYFTLLSVYSAGYLDCRRASTTLTNGPAIQ